MQIIIIDNHLVTVEEKRRFSNGRKLAKSLLLYTITPPHLTLHDKYVIPFFVMHPHKGHKICYIDPMVY